jgi:recombination protein RecA
LDKLLNGAGIPCGRLTEIFGPAHIGKSSLLDHIFAQVQKDGGIAILADTEVSRDMKYSAAIGVDTAKMQYLAFSNPIPTIEDVILAVMDSIKFWKEKYPETPVVIGWDALGGTATADEVEKFDTDGKTKPGAAAKTMAMAKRQLIPALGGTNIAFVVINHTYEKINMMGVGKKRETYGGEAVRLAASIRMEMHHVMNGRLKDSQGVVLGHKVGARLVKNRLGNPNVECEFAIIPGKGIDNTWTLFDDLKGAGLITTSGSWGSFNLEGDIQKFQGFNGFTRIMVDHPETFQKLVAVHQGLSHASV